MRHRPRRFHTLTLLATLLSTAALVGCEDDADDPGAVAPGSSERPPRTPEDDISRNIFDSGLPSAGGAGGMVGEGGGGGPIGGDEPIAGGAGGAPQGGAPAGGQGGGAGGQGGCTPAPEICDGADNDCDDAVDEGTSGGACSVGEGECAAEGTLTCVNGASDCVADGPPAGGFETCDGIDNDCDGSIDEDFDDGRVCCSMDEHCPAGQSCVDRTCSDGAVEPPVGGGGGGGGGGVNPGAGCAGAQPLPGPGSYFGQTVGDASSVEGTCSLISGPEAVYSLSVNARQRVRIDTDGSLFDTVLYVQTQCGDFLSEVACNDDVAGLFTPSEVEFVAEPGVTYSVVVDSLFGGGLYAINVEYLADVQEPAPECVIDGDCPGGQCVDGTCVADQPPPPGADVCNTPVAILNGGDLQGSTANGTPVHAGGCGQTANSPEAAFVFTPAATGDVTFTTDADFDTVMYVRTTCGDDGTELLCNDDGGEGRNSEVTFNAEAGATYYIIVDGYNGAEGAFTLRYQDVEAPAPPEEPEDPPVGDIICEGSQVLPGFGERQGTTAGGGSQHSGSCQLGDPSPEQVWFFTVDVPQRVAVEIVDADFDTIISARTVCADADTEVACDDDDGAGLLSLMEFDVVPEEIYSIIVDGYNGNSGAYTLSFSSVP